MTRMPSHSQSDSGMQCFRKEKRDVFQFIDRISFYATRDPHLVCVANTHRVSGEEEEEKSMLLSFFVFFFVGKMVVQSDAVHARPLLPSLSLVFRRESGSRSRSLACTHTHSIRTSGGTREERKEKRTRVPNSSNSLFTFLHVVEVVAAPVHDVFPRVQEVTVGSVALSRVVKEATHLLSL